MTHPKTLYLASLLAIAAVLATGSGADAAPAALSQGVSPAALAALKCEDGQAVSQRYAQAEIDAYYNSGYTYWDAAQLASYWGQNLDDTKARMGRKMLWGAADIAMLEQFLLDARLASLSSVDDLRFYGESEYTYQDAVVLAEFWGDATPYDAKLRIERNLIMGSAYEVDNALELAAP
ncbi:MAG TPA: hypothetical protein VLS96_00500 [Nodosilinea sp.]|nr:hypothetical protein [Nodosilinea sp.]